MRRKDHLSATDRFFSNTFEYHDFKRTLSYREFVTSISLALLCTALIILATDLSTEDWIHSHRLVLHATSFFVLLPMNHVFYRIEHRRSNNFIGRAAHDCIFLLFLYAFMKLSFHFYVGPLSTASSPFGNETWEIILVGAIFVMVFETVVSVINAVFKFFGWHVF